VAHILRLKGFEAFVMLGGLKAWQKARYPMELIPADDVMLLPRFD